MPNDLGCLCRVSWTFSGVTAVIILPRIQRSDIVGTEDLETIGDDKGASPVYEPYEKKKQ